MFASKTIVEHVARGALGTCAITTAALGSALPLWIRLALLAVGFVAWRGCPACWTVGLVQTIAGRRRTCSGSCPP